MKPQRINSTTEIIGVDNILNLDTAYSLLDRSTISDGTKELYKKNVVHFLNFIQEHGLNRKSLLLFRDELEQPIYKKDGKGLVSDRTKNGYLAAAIKLVKQAIRYDKITEDINTDIVGFKLEKDHKEGLSFEEVLKVLAVIKQEKKDKKRLKNNALFHLMAFRGLRQMEVQGIRIEWIDFDKNTIRFRRKGQRKQWTLNKEGQKVENFGKYESHKCFPRVLAAMKAYIDFLGRSEGYLFCGLRTINKEGKNARVIDPEKPMKLESIRKAFKETATGKTPGLFQVAGLPEARSLHGTRHFFGSFLIAKGYSPAEVARLLGHKTLDMVMVYYDNANMENLMHQLEKDFSSF